MDMQMIDMETSGTIARFPLGLGVLGHGAVHHVVRIIHYLLTVESLSATERQVSGDEIEQQFEFLVSRWRSQTGMLSSPTQKAAHPDYLRIIAMRKLALPFILRELRDHGGQWYSALEAITGINPIPSDAIGYVPRMKAAWLEWGKSEGFI